MSFTSMSRFLNHVKDRIEERKMQSNQHDFVGEVAPSRLDATRTSLDYGHRRNRSSISPTPSSGTTGTMKRSNSHSTIGIATAGSDALDLDIQFISAHGLPRMDVVGAGCDPYFRVEIDNAIEYT
jgi:BRCT domain type II-containing protein